LPDSSLGERGHAACFGFGDFARFGVFGQCVGDFAEGIGDRRAIACSACSLRALAMSVSN